MRTLVLLAIAAASACYDPTYEGLLCAGNVCPDGHVCVSGTCLATTGECGDGVPSQPELCDDGNLVTELACPYGTPTCTRCNADCSQPLALSGNTCGDGNVDAANEACDDTNAVDCGGCSADCQDLLPAGMATGTLMNVAGLSAANEGQTFTLLDGVNINRLTYELDTNGSSTAPYIRVSIGGGAVVGVIGAINSSSILIDASDAGGGHVLLVNQRLSGRGNQPIETTIPAPFAVTGMLGGAGADCAPGTGCSVAGDCFSNVCTNRVCQ